MKYLKATTTLTWRDIPVLANPRVKYHRAPNRGQTYLLRVPGRPKRS